jgi:hypothetical protein
MSDNSENKYAETQLQRYLHVMAYSIPYSGELSATLVADACSLTALRIAGSEQRQCGKSARRSKSHPQGPQPDLSFYTRLVAHVRSTCGLTSPASTYYTASIRSLSHWAGNQTDFVGRRSLWPTETDNLHVCWHSARPASYPGPYRVRGRGPIHIDWAVDDSGATPLPLLPGQSYCIYSLHISLSCDGTQCEPFCFWAERRMMHSTGTSTSSS